MKLKYSPVIGTLLGGKGLNPEALWPSWWHSRFPGVTWVFNPYTGARRDYRDVTTDPMGYAIVAPGEPLRAAPLHAEDRLLAAVVAAVPAAVAPAKAMLLPEDPKVRKELVITTGVLDYFPLALAEVARVSKAGNDQHNPGKPLHWDKTKSMDHADCIPRHLIDRGARDTDGQRHSAKLAWRALALLQIELENEAKEQA
jgi:hypothetical protein